MYSTPSIALNNACEVGLDLGDFTQVITWAEEGMRLARGRRGRRHFRGPSSTSAVWRASKPATSTARAVTYATAVELHAQEGSLLHGLDAVPRLAACYASRDKPRAAAVLLGTFEAAIAGLKLAEQPVMRQIRERHLDHQPTQLGADFHAALREGRDLFTAAGPSGVLAAVLKTLNALDETEGDRLEGRQAGAAHPVK